ncbi:sulfite exporter TauE/SafE family protein [Aestuariivirga litoralis]|uniref:sulfite exporter TauE/SafE family protein n=1 Tax=Aestuariivirga litoralis TaxID=2650924 RepID=UPI0018C81BBB|nr:sulfite exporter TauE/SafE family protein [Aestuariivirga litoralis]MBG1232819.1 sulfite exporter TauE/SafE family protein [Aestuariivirga litoralis]
MLGLDTISTITWAGLFAAAFTAGLARGFSGFGAALIFVPLASVFIDPKAAPPLLVLIDIVFSAHLIPRATRIANRRDVMWMFSGALIGIPLGATILANMPLLPLRWLISFMVTAMLVLLMSGWRYHGKPSAFVTSLVGAVSGIFSGIAQIGGPPVIAYWFGTGTAPEVLRANVIAFFALGSVTSIVVYAWHGLFNWHLAAIALVTGPVYGIGTFLGTRLFGKASPQFFRNICFVIIACAILVSLPVW